MKHTKLLPILSTCLITATCPIVTSCNTGFDGKVTDDEMSKAIDELTDCNSWNITTDCVENAYDAEGTLTDTANLLYKFTPTGASSTLIDMPVLPSTTWVKKYQNEWFYIYPPSESTFTVHTQLGNQPLNSQWLEPWKALKQYKSDIVKAIFNAEHKGYYYWDTTNKQIWFFKFNSNKKIDYFFYEYFNEDYNQYFSQEFKNNYGSTTIEYPFKDEDIDYPAKAELEYDSENICYTSQSGSRLRYGCTFVANNNLLKPTKLQILDGDEVIEYEITDVSLYVNGQKINCACSWDSTNHLSYISGLDLNKDDQVVLIWNFGKYIFKSAPNFTIKLS